MTPPPEAVRRRVHRQPEGRCAAGGYGSDGRRAHPGAALVRLELAPQGEY